MAFLAGNDLRNKNLKYCYKVTGHLYKTPFCIGSRVLLISEDYTSVTSIKQLSLGGAGS
jgi:hypothetical protein